MTAAPGNPVPSSERVVQLSLTWIVIGIVGMLAFGVLGAVIAQQFFGPPLPPLTAEGERLVTTVQEVTISPNQATGDMVNRVNRSVVVIGRQDGEQRVLLATGFVVTNDGLVVTTGQLPAGDVSAFDHEGRPLALERVGSDELFGITYLRLRDAVVVPLDVQQGDVPVGQVLIALSRNQTTYLPRLAPFRLQEYALPPSLAPAGVQRIALGSPITDALYTGSPLLDEEGRVAAVFQNPSAGIALPVSHLQASLQRMSTNRREFNPFATLGFTVHPTFRAVTAGQAVQFVAEVAVVEPRSSANTSGLQRGDLITGVGNESFDWQRPLVTALSQALPLQLNVNRQGQAVTVQLQAAPASPLPTPRPASPTASSALPTPAPTR